MAHTRMECSAEGFEDNWISVEMPWTRGDTRALGAAQDDDALLALLRAKLAECHIVCVNGDVLASPEDLTDDALDGVDETVWGWLMGSLYTVIARRRSLGELSARASSSTNGRTPAPMPTAIAEK